MNVNIKGYIVWFCDIIQYIRLDYIIERPKGMNHLKKTVSLSLDHDVVEGIKGLAEESDRSFSQYVNMVLKRILKNKAEREQEEKED